MTQPSYAPIAEEDRVRPAYRLRTPPDWRATRPAELRLPGQPLGPELGVPGPDQGYALLVAEELYANRIKLGPGITLKDAIHGCAAVACARSGRFGRAPIAKDVEFALELFGFVGDPPEDLVSWRNPLFQAVSHDYHAQRRIVDLLPETTLRMPFDKMRSRLSDWSALLVDEATAADVDSD